MVAVVGSGSAGANPPPPFELYWVTAQSSLEGSHPGLLFIGDSLLDPLNGDPTLAEHFQSATGLQSVTMTAPGSSYPNWINEGWLGYAGFHPPGLEALTKTIEPRVTVIALGANDARVVRDTDGRYSPAHVKMRIHKAVEQARATAACIVLVNVANPSGNVKAIQTMQVNVAIAEVAAESPSVHRANWRLFAKAHSDPDDPNAWFDGDRVHLSPSGRLAYAEFLSDYVDDLIERGAC